MDKPYRRLRAKHVHKKKKEQGKDGMWFLLRMAVCLVLFLSFAGIRLRGGTQLSWAKEQVDYFLGGTAEVAEAYRQSVDAIRAFWGGVPAEK